MYLFLGILIAAPARAGAPSTDPGVLIVNTAHAIKADTSKKAHKAVLRCMLPTGNEQPLLVYLPPPENPHLADVFQRTLGWSEEMFERQRANLEMRAGRKCYYRKNSEQDVIDAVALNPGAVGIVGATAVLPDSVRSVRIPE